MSIQKATGYALVLGCDLNNDCSDIGPRTECRLQKGLQHWNKTGERLVVAAGTSPNHPQHKEPMAQIMARWLEKNKCENVLVLEAERFNTRGELDEFLKLVNPRTVISSTHHLRRIKLMVAGDYGLVTYRSLQYVPVSDETSSWKDRYVMETLKLAFEIFTFGWSRQARNWLTGRLRMLR